MEQLLNEKIANEWKDEGEFTDIFDMFNKLTLALNCRCFAGEEINTYLYKVFKCLTNYNSVGILSDVL